MLIGAHTHTGVRTAHKPTNAHRSNRHTNETWSYLHFLAESKSPANGTVRKSPGEEVGTYGGEMASKRGLFGVSGAPGGVGAFAVGSPLASLAFPPSTYAGQVMQAAFGLTSSQQKQQQQQRNHTHQQLLSSLMASMSHKSVVAPTSAPAPTPAAGLAPTATPVAAAATSSPSLLLSPHLLALSQSIATRTADPFAIRQTLLTATGGTDTRSNRHSFQSSNDEEEEEDEENELNEPVVVDEDENEAPLPRKKHKTETAMSSELKSQLITTGSSSKLWRPY